MAGERMFTVALEGADDLQRTLKALPAKIKNKAVSKALRAAGVVIRDAARAAAPVLQTPHPYRTKGLVKRKISVRTSKFAKRDGNLGVFVSVRPAQGAKYRAGKLVRASKRGAQSRDDPYYWWWVEFGHRKVPRKSAGGAGIAARRRLASGTVPARPFMVPASRQLDAALRAFERVAGPAIDAINKPES